MLTYGNFDAAANDRRYVMYWEICKSVNCLLLVEDKFQLFFAILE